MSTTRTEPEAQFRPHRGRAVAGFIVMISMLTLVTVSSWFALLLVAPAAFIGWVLRAGTDADADGLRVRALLGERRVSWPEVDTLQADSRGGVVVRLHRGTTLPLTAVTPADLPRLAAIGGHRDP